MTDLQNTQSAQVLVALQKIENVVRVKKARQVEKQLAEILCSRFMLQEDRDLRLALAPDQKTLSMVEAVSVWIGRQSVEPIRELTDHQIESYASLLRRKLFGLLDMEWVA